MIKQKTGEKQNPELLLTAKAKLEDIELVDRVEIAGAGYINVFFNRPKLLAIFARAAKEINNERQAPLNRRRWLSTQASIQ
jgi:arginyl-tRNA synthetase